MTVLGELVVKIAAETTGFQLGMAGVVGALVGLGAMTVESVKSAGDFQESMTRLTTSAGELASNLPMVSSGILQMSTDTATSTDQLAKGMYFVESSGFHAAAGLDVLRVAAEGARSENADLDTVASALTTTMVDYHLPVDQASNAMNGLIVAVQNGKTTLQALSTSMGAVLPIAASMGISFPQVAGAMDTMTNAGMSSQHAAQNIAHVLVALSAPSAVASKSMAAVGISAQQLKDTLDNQGIAQAFQLVEQHVGSTFPAKSIAAEQALKNILGGMVGLKTAAMLTGSSLAETEQNVAKITAGMSGAKPAVLGWDLVQKNFNFTLAQSEMAGKALMITLGTALLPVFGRLMGQINPLVNAFMAWEAKTHGLETAVGILATVLSDIGTVIGKIVSVGAGIVSFFEHSQLACDILIGVLSGLAAVFLFVNSVEIIFAIIAAPAAIAGFIGMAGAALLAAGAALLAAAPFILIGIVVAAVVIGIILAVQHWGAIVQWVGGVMSWLGDHVHQIMSAIGGFVGDVFSAMGDRVRQIMTGLKNDVGGAFDSMGTQMRQSATKTKNDVGNLFDALGTHLREAATATKNGVGTAFSAIGTTIQDAATGAVAAGQWMYIHNKYWQMAADEIGKAFSDLGTQMHESATKVKNDVGGIFDGLGTQLRSWATDTKNFMGGQFNDMGTQMTASATKTHNDVGNQFAILGSQMRTASTVTKNFVGSAMDTLGTHVSQAVDTMRANSAVGFNSLGTQARGVITALKNDVLDKIGAMVGGVANWLGTMVSEGIAKARAFCSGLLAQIQNLAGELWQAGANLIGMLIGGIESKLGALAGAVGQAAGQLASVLGFRSPAKEGPGSDADVWMPNLMTMMTNGLISGAPKLKAAALSAAAMVASAFGGGSALSLQASSASPFAGGVAGSQKAVDITLELDGKVLAQALGQPLVDSIRLKTGLRI
jgi:TP901 family phage tail tape measure protein